MDTTDQYSSSYNTNGLFGVKKFANKHAITKDWYFVSIIFYSRSTENSKWHMIYIDCDTRLYNVGCIRMKWVTHGVSGHKCLETGLCWKTQYIKSQFLLYKDCIQQCVSRKKPHTHTHTLKILLHFQCACCQWPRKKDAHSKQSDHKKTHSSYKRVKVC